MNITTLGIDLAKTSFSLVGMDQCGKVVLRKTLSVHSYLALLRSVRPALLEWKHERRFDGNFIPISTIQTAG